MLTLFKDELYQSEIDEVLFSPELRGGEGDEDDDIEEDDEEIDFGLEGDDTIDEEDNFPYLSIDDYGM